MGLYTGGRRFINGVIIKLRNAWAYKRGGPIQDFMVFWEKDGLKTPKFQLERLRRSNLLAKILVVNLQLYQRRTQPELNF